MRVATTPENAPPKNTRLRTSMALDFIMSVSVRGKQPLFRDFARAPRKAGFAAKIAIGQNAERDEHHGSDCHLREERADLVPEGDRLGAHLTRRRSCHRPTPHPDPLPVKGRGGGDALLLGGG